MAKFCAQCGTQVDETAKFCKKCGASLAPPQSGGYSAPTVGYQTSNFQDYQGQPGFGAGQPPYQQPPHQQPYQPGYDANSFWNPHTKPNIVATLCYVIPFILSIVFLVLNPYNKNRFIRFHALQSLFFVIALGVLNVVMGTVLGILPWPLSMISRLYFSMAPFLYLGGIIWLAIKAYNYEWFKIPFIGDLIEGIVSENRQ